MGERANGATEMLQNLEDTSVNHLRANDCKKATRETLLSFVQRAARACLWLIDASQVYLIKVHLGGTPLNIYLDIYFIRG